ncbi:MAG: MFS transporter [Bacillus cereus]|jgi:MFS family permease|nr:MFS transporter [Bacillus cereus]
MNNKKIYKLFGYVSFSNLFFERSIFVLYLAYKGLTISQIAIFQGIINIAMMIGEIPSGIIADQIGKKKALMIGNVMMIFYYLCMLHSGKFLVAIFGAIIYGVGSTFITGTDEAYLYDLITDREASVKYLGQLSAVITCSIGAAMFLGGYIQKIKWEMIIVLGVIAQIAGIIVLLFLPNITYKANENKLTTVATFFISIKKNNFIQEIMIFLGINVGIVSATYILAQDLFNQYGMSTEHISMVFVVETALSVFVFSKIETILKKIGKLRSLFISTIGTIIAFTCMNIHNIYIIAAMVLVISLLNNYFSTVLMDEYNNQLEDHVRATGISCFNMLSSLLMAFIFLLISKFESQYIIFLSAFGVISTVALIFTIKKFHKILEKKDLQKENGIIGNSFFP